MTSPLEVVVALQNNLVEARATETILSGLPEWMTELHAEYSKAKGEVDALQAVAETAGKERRDAETAIAESQEKLKHYQQQMTLVRNQREYGALLQEIDHAKVALRKLEEQALAAVEKLEGAEREVASRREAFADLDRRYAEGLSRWEQEKPQLAAKLAELKSRIDGLREQLPKPVLRQFERIFERLKGDATAPVRRVERAGSGVSLWHCGSCHYQVRPQVAMEIRGSGIIVQCESCKRLLTPEEGA
ncbi:MAG: hypothetical protein IPJ17_04205 [Holophagales bacterium]|nr:MAG: hypothetical protein IPJ17_04205 [Holophagales bacterium]